MSQKGDLRRTPFEAVKPLQQGGYPQALCDVRRVCQASKIQGGRLTGRIAALPDACSDPYGLREQLIRIAGTRRGVKVTESRFADSVRHRSAEIRTWCLASKYSASRG